MRELARVRGEANPELHELAHQISGVAAVHDREELLDGQAAHGLRARRVGTFLGGFTRTRSTRTTAPRSTISARL